MTQFPNPTAAQIEAAFRRHNVNYRVEPLLANSRGRPWSQGLRAIVDHHTAGTNSVRFMQNAGGSSPFVQTVIARTGFCHVLSFLSCWGSGAGGPWNGVAARDSLHLVGWQNEVEDRGTNGRTFTPEQLVTLGRVNAALVSLGVPAANEVNHRSWTDGTDGVTGSPMPFPTRGRKIDTRYSVQELRANTALYRIGAPPPTPPPIPIPEGLPDMFMYRNPARTEAILVDGGRQVLMGGPSANAALQPLAGPIPLYFQADQTFMDRMVRAFGSIIR